MGRKAKNNIQKATSVSEPNIRMNFLYQASNLLAYTFYKTEQSDFKVKDKIKCNNNNNNNSINNTNERITRKRKRIPLRLKRNRYIKDLNKNIKKDKSFDKNAMDIDGHELQDKKNELQNKEMKSILNKDYPLLPLSRYYNTTLNVVAQKTVSRMDPNIKRSICKCCKTPLIPGLTSDIKVDDDETKFEILCKSCQTSRIFKSDDPNYCLFTEKAAITVKEYEQYLDAMTKENQKGKR